MQPFLILSRLGHFDMEEEEGEEPPAMRPLLSRFGLFDVVEAEEWGISKQKESEVRAETEIASKIGHTSSSAFKWGDATG